MQFEDDGTAVKALLNDPRGTTPIVSDLSDLSILERSERQLILEATQKYLLGKAFKTQLAAIHTSVRRFAQFLHAGIFKCEGKLPPNYDDWQLFILEFGLWYISRESSEELLAGRCKNWDRNVTAWLTFLQEEGVIPLGLVFPRMQLAMEKSAFPSPGNPRLIGELPASVVEDQLDGCKSLFQETLAGPIFWDSDSEFLDRIHSKLSYRNELLKQTLDDYWRRLVSDYRSGKIFLRRVTESDWLAQEQLGKWSVSETNQKRCFISASNPQGHLWGLRFLRQQLINGHDVNCLVRTHLWEHPAAANSFFKHREGTPVQPLIDQSALDPDQSEHFKARHIFYRYLGILNQIDYVVALAILVQEHPNLNPLSLAGAKLLNSSGKSYFIVTGETGNSKIFSVDKPRAKSRKYAVLSRRASRVIKHLLRSTAPVRELLRRSGSPQWRYLFLGDVSRGKLGHPRIIRTYVLNGKAASRLSITSLYPSLSEAGITSETLNFTKIRNTQGVLEWFKTGSIHAVSKRLGNSQRTVIDAYIPQPLLAAWNERIIRRFQNTILILAAHEENWLLEVLDVPNLEELNRFLAQLVFEMPNGTSPIADKIHIYFGDRFTVNTEIAVGDSIKSTGQLHIRLSSNSLAILLAYREWAASNLSHEDRELADSVTGLRPAYFIELGSMLLSAIKNNDIGDALRESLDLAKLERCYDRAIQMVPRLIEQIKQFSIQNTI